MLEDKRVKNKFFKRLAVQTSLYFLIITIVAVIISALLLYSALSSIILQQSIDYTKNSLENSGKYIDDYLKKLDLISSNLASNPQINRFISDTHDNDPLIEADVLSIIESSLRSDKYLKSITIISKDGKLLSTSETAFDISLSSDMENESWYEEAIHCSGMPMLSGAKMTEFSSNKDTWVISLTKDICNESGSHLGIALIEVDYLAIEDYIMRQDLGSTGYAFILDHESSLVFHHDPSYFTDADKISKLNEFAKMDIGYDSHANALLHKYTINNGFWTLIAVDSMDELVAVKIRMINIFVLIGGLLVLIVISIAIFMSRRVTKPIRQLEIKMREFDDKFNMIDLDESACYEAQSLSMQFNEMVKTIKLLVSEIEHKAKSMKLYELNALRSQINPHFLYNTLDTIIWMAEFKDHNQVIDITKSLAKFFRLSLSRGDEKIKVCDEIDHVRQYLYIQSKRYEDMRYDITMTEDIAHIKIPKIILQPIVENALYHGIRPKQGVGTIKIDAYKQDADIIITIQDDGVGFNNSLSETSSKPTKLGGVGIKNVDQRIKLAYGKEYGIKIESKIGLGTTAILKLKI